MTDEKNVSYKSEKKDIASDMQTPSSLQKNTKNQASSNKNIIISVLIIATLFALLMTFVLIKRRKTDPIWDNQLRGYILGCLNQGYGIDQIKQYLLSNNYKEKDIERIIKTMHPSKKE